MNVLILKPSSLGDVVQALPVLRLLKRHWPEARVHWWIDVRLGPLLEGDPDVAGLVPFDRQQWRSPRCWPQAWRSLLRMRREQYDLVIDLQALARSGLVTWLSRGRLKVGLEDMREGAATFYDVRVARPSRLTHAVDWYLAVLRRLEVPVDGRFTWLPERPQVAARLLERWPANDAFWVALQPGARWANKRWPVEFYAALVRRLAEEHRQLRFAVLGSRDERTMAETVCAARPDLCLNLAGQNTLPEMVEWIRRCRLMISNDTGPMHVAAALGKPVVALFGPTEPRRTGPYGQVERALQQRLACVPCMKPRCHRPQPCECLHSLTVEQVRGAVRQRLAETGGQP